MGRDVSSLTLLLLALLLLVGRVRCLLAEGREAGATSREVPSLDMTPSATVQRHSTATHQHQLLPDAHHRGGRPHAQLEVRRGVETRGEVRRGRDTRGEYVRRGGEGPRRRADTRGDVRRGRDTRVQSEGRRGGREDTRLPIASTVLASSHRRPRRGEHLQFYGLEVPVYKFRGEDAQLKCKYDRKNDPLYSVKWYKDDSEFFSFMFTRNTPKNTFPMPGVNVDVHRSNDRQVLLKNLTFESSGKYKCEVSADYPLFHTYYNESTMVVVELPEDGPKISGGQTHYAQGDIARFNCTSSRSRPAAELTWYLNGQPVHQSYLVPYYPFQHPDGLYSKRLGLTFTVDSGHFSKGEMLLKCEAVVAAVNDPLGQDLARVFQGQPIILEKGEARMSVRSGALRLVPLGALLLVPLLLLAGHPAVT